MQRILYIEDDDSLRGAVRLVLENAGYEAVTQPDGTQLLEALFRGEEVGCHLILLDMGLPKMDGTALLLRVRERSCVPVLALSGQDDELSVIDALAHGCDDYLTKPVRPALLLAKVAGLLRRARFEGEGDGAKRPRVLELGNVRCGKGECRIDGLPVALTPTELELLRYYLARPDKTVPRSQLLLDVWGLPDGVESRTADEMTRRLRRKLEPAGASVSLRSVWGVGYRLEGPCEET